MSFRLVPKLVTLNDLERPTMAVAFYYFTEFGKRVDLWRNFMKKSIIFRRACTMSS